MDEMDEDSFCRSNNRDFTDPFAFQNYRFGCCTSLSDLGWCVTLPTRVGSSPEDPVGNTRLSSALRYINKTEGNPVSILFTNLNSSCNSNYDSTSRSESNLKRYKTFRWLTILPQINSLKSISLTHWLAPCGATQ